MPHCEPLDVAHVVDAMFGLLEAEAEQAERDEKASKRANRKRRR